MILTKKSYCFTANSAVSDKMNPVGVVQRDPQAFSLITLSREFAMRCTSHLVKFAPMVFLFAVLGAGTSFAATYTWDITPGTIGLGNNQIDDGSGTWEVISGMNGNWTSDIGVNNVPWVSNTTNIAAFTGVNGGTITASGSLSAGGITIDGSSSYLFNGDASSPLLTLDSAGITIHGTAAHTFDSTLGMTLSNSQTWSNNSSNLLAVNSAIANGGNLLTIAGTGNTTLGGILGNGAGGLMMSGNGMLILSGTNTFSGGTTLNAGNLTLGSTAALGATAGMFTISGGSLDSSVANLVNAKNNPVTLNSDFTFVGSQNLNLGTGILSLGTAAGTTRTITVNANTLTLGGVIINGTTATGLTKAGPGTLALNNNANTFSGKIVVNAGTLSLAGVGSMGTAPGSLVTDFMTLNGATLTYNTSQSNNNTNTNRGIMLGISGGTIGSNMGSWDGPISGTGNLCIANGQFRISGGGSGGASGSYDSTYTGDTIILSGGQVCPYRTNSMQYSTLDLSLQPNGMRNLNGISAIVLGGLKGSQNENLSLTDSVYTLSIGNNNKDTTYSGVLSGSVNQSVIKTGTGTLTFSGSNSFAGQLTIQSGKLAVLTINNVSAAGPLGQSALNVILGKTGSVTGTLEYTGTTASSSKPFTMATGGTGAFQIDSADAVLTLSGSINGSGGLSKTGPGTLKLTGANIYSGGTTINAGGLVLGNGVALSGSGAMTLNGGSLISGPTGSIGGMLLAGSGTHSIIPGGSGAIGTLTLGGNLTLNNNSTLDFDIIDNVTDTLSLSGGSLTYAGALNLSFPSTAPSVPQIYHLFSGFNAGQIGTFASINKPPAPTGLKWRDFGTNQFVDYATGTVELDLSAVTATWSLSSGTVGNWITGTNWTGGIAPASQGDTATLGSGTASAIDLSGATPTVSALIFDNLGSANYEIKDSIGTGSLTLHGMGTSPASVTVNTGSDTISTNIDLASDLVISGSGKLALSGSITETLGSHSLTMSGTGGTLILSGTGLYTGGTIVNAGTLAVTTSTALPDGYNLTVGAGGTLIFDPSYSFSSIIATPVSATSSAVMGAVSPVPEPSTLVLLIAGLAVGLGAWRRRK